MIIQEQIKEGNKLISVFKKYKYSDCTRTFYQIPEHKYKDGHGWQYDFYPEEMKFHSSWEWLMPIVHKCLRICYKLNLKEWERSFTDKFLRCEIICMYKEVVKFIKWRKANK